MLPNDFIIISYVEILYSLTRILFLASNCAKSVEWWRHQQFWWLSRKRLQILADTGRSRAETVCGFLRLCSHELEDSSYLNLRKLFSGDIKCDLIYFWNKSTFSFCELWIRREHYLAISSFVIFWPRYLGLLYIVLNTGYTEKGNLANRMILLIVAVCCYVWVVHIRMEKLFFRNSLSIWVSIGT